MEIKKFEQQKERIETGPVQFGNDWPGIFIRGDHAGYLAFTLSKQLEKEDFMKNNVIERIQIECLRDLLSSCVIGPAKEIIK